MTLHSKPATISTTPRAPDYTVEATVWATTEFIGMHRFPDAAKLFPARAYLEHPHRHKFFVRVEMPVNHHDREIEYHELKDWLDSEIAYTQRNGGFPLASSCEALAQMILRWLMNVHGGRTWYQVTVSEDNENGSTLTARS